ncbi:MAG: NYN domain-containing protein [Salinarimonas sp.]
MRRVIAYIDGFNLYHAIDDLRRPHLKWLDLWSLCASICGSGETLTAVNFYTALPGWKPAALSRHREYLKALRASGVTCILGHFKEKQRSCRRCGSTWLAHEEKETDVAIAVQVVADALTGACERAIIVSADSDLAPALKIIRAYRSSGLSANVVAPPGRLAAARDLAPIFELTRGRIGKHLLPDSMIDANGAVLFTRPASYDPPA